jgi:hypothetical protein
MYRKCEPSLERFTSYALVEFTTEKERSVKQWLRDCRGSFWMDQGMVRFGRQALQELSSLLSIADGDTRSAISSAIERYHPRLAASHDASAAKVRRSSTIKPSALNRDVESDVVALYSLLMMERPKQGKARVKEIDDQLLATWRSALVQWNAGEAQRSVVTLTSLIERIEELDESGPGLGAVFHQRGMERAFLGDVDAAIRDFLTARLYYLRCVTDSGRDSNALADILGGFVLSMIEVLAFQLCHELIKHRRSESWLLLALECSDIGYRISKEKGDSTRLLVHLVNKGLCFTHLCDMDRARAIYLESVAMTEPVVTRSSEERVLHAFGCWRLSVLARALDRSAEAIRFVELAASVKDRWEYPEVASYWDEFQADELRP